MATAATALANRCIKCAVPASFGGYVLGYDDWARVESAIEQHETRDPSLL